MRLIVLFFAFLALSPTSILAQTEHPATGTLITLSATSALEQANDEAQITFRVEQEGTNEGQIRQYVNQTTGVIRKRLNREPGVEIKTISRIMQPVWEYPKNGKRTRIGWRMVQTEQVVSRNLDAVPSWLDTIEAAGARLSSLQFRVSRSAAKQVRAKLLHQAISDFRRKAENTTRSLSAKQFKIIRLDTSERSPQPSYFREGVAMMAKSNRAPQPSLSAGKGRLAVTVRGTIEVPFTNFPVR